MYNLREQGKPVAPVEVSYVLGVLNRRARINSIVRALSKTHFPITHSFTYKETKT